MGNTSAKESRPPFAHTTRHGRSGAEIGDGYSSYTHPSGSSRHHRGSRPDLSFLGIGGNERDGAQVETRRETKQEREARKREKERAARLVERERSMKEEHVDGGYLVTQGVYVGSEDFSKNVVRQLMIERKIAPFWKGLNDFSESWVEHQIMAAVRGLPIPAADEIPPELEYTLQPKSQAERSPTDRNINHLTVPITSRSQSYNSDRSRPASPHGRSSAVPSPSASHIFRGRAKTLASLTTSSKNTRSPDMSPREFKLPHDPFVNGQPVEAYLYKDGSECPICFLYYPPYLNQTRCCDQPICSECFVQIKRPDPHPPEHETTDPNAPRPENEGENQSDELISEPAACPFCVQPELGVTYSPPPFRRGLTYAANNGSHPLASASSAASSSSSVATGAVNSPFPGSRRRATSLSADAPGVITTDRIRPDWAQKLATARAHASRRSAAATALHTAAYLVNSNNAGNANEQRIPGNGSRRSMLRRPTGPPAGPGADSPGSRTTPPHVTTLANLAERRAVVDPDDDRENDRPHLAPPRASSRRNRVEDLEDIMMMEAIRLSLAAEDERRRKDEKEAKKEAKRRNKEARKAEKRSRKTNLYSGNPSTVSLSAEASGSRNRADTAPLPATEDTSIGKGKGVDRSPPPDSPTEPESPANAGPSTTAATSDKKTPEDEQRTSSLHSSASAELSKRLHFRQMSSASSSNSSLVESALGEQIGTNAPHNGSNSSLEPLFNFQSLAEVIGDEDKSPGTAEHSENSKQGTPQLQGESAKEEERGGQSPPGASDQSPIPSTQEARNNTEDGLDTKEGITHSERILPGVKSVETN